MRKEAAEKLAELANICLGNLKVLSSEMDQADSRLIR
jgi:hypothetical protein